MIASREKDDTAADLDELAELVRELDDERKEALAEYLQESEREHGPPNQSESPGEDHQG